jgi:hypothetical protein
MGRRLILLKASVAMGELSVRIVVPMAMKKLSQVVSDCACVVVANAPTRMKRTMLVNPEIVSGLLQMLGMVRTEDEADDEANSCGAVKTCSRALPHASTTYIHPSCHPSSLHCD